MFSIQSNGFITKQGAFMDRKVLASLVTESYVNEILVIFSRL